MTTYTVQRLARIGRETCWYDVTETFAMLPWAEASLERFRQDLPHDDFRIEAYDGIRETKV